MFAQRQKCLNSLSGKTGLTCGTLLFMIKREREENTEQDGKFDVQEKSVAINVIHMMIASWRAPRVIRAISVRSIMPQAVTMSTRQCRRGRQIATMARA